MRGPTAGTGDGARRKTLRREKPGGTLSRQYHHRRDELDGETLSLGEKLYILRGTVHRLSSEDVYGRAVSETGERPNGGSRDFGSI